MIAPIETEGRATCRDRWQQVKQTDPALGLSAHQALRALQFEDKAEQALARIRFSEPFEAYTLCDVLADLARALEAWAYISARLWHLCETGQPNAEIKALQAGSTEQYRRLFAQRLHVQQLTFVFCQEHQVILRCGVITQALDVSRSVPAAEKGEPLRTME